MVVSYIFGDILKFQLFDDVIKNKAAVIGKEFILFSGHDRRSQIAELVSCLYQRLNPYYVVGILKKRGFLENNQNNDVNGYFFTSVVGHRIVALVFQRILL